MTDEKGPRTFFHPVGGNYMPHIYGSTGGFLAARLLVTFYPGTKNTNKIYKKSSCLLLVTSKKKRRTHTKIPPKRKRENINYIP